MYSNVEAELRRKGITRAILAERLGLTPSTVSTKMNRKTEFTLAEAKEIKHMLRVDIPIDELFAWTEDPAANDHTNPH